MIFIVIAMIVGVFLGLYTPYDFPPEISQYIAVGLVAALDTIFGALSAIMMKRFDVKVFFTGFFMNSILAAVFVYGGNHIGVNLNFAVQVVFGARIFNNLSTMRHLWLSTSRKNSDN